jgi:hypothetical protein
VRGPISAEDVARLAFLVGVRFPVDDLGPVGDALTDHRKTFETLLSLEFGQAGSSPALDPAPVLEASLVFDPRWRD